MWVAELNNEIFCKRGNETRKLPVFGRGWNDLFLEFLEAVGDLVQRMVACEQIEHGNASRIDVNFSAVSDVLDLFGGHVERRTNIAADLFVLWRFEPRWEPEVDNF